MPCMQLTHVPFGNQIAIAPYVYLSICNVYVKNIVNNHYVYARLVLHIDIAFVSKPFWYD